MGCRRCRDSRSAWLAWKEARTSPNCERTTSSVAFLLSETKMQIPARRPNAPRASPDSAAPCCSWVVSADIWRVLSVRVRHFQRTLASARYSSDNDSRSVLAGALLNLFREVRSGMIQGCGGIVLVLQPRSSLCDIWKMNYCRAVMLREYSSAEWATSNSQSRKDMCSWLSDIPPTTRRIGVSTLKGD